jgi:hypothetical protein
MTVFPQLPIVIYLAYFQILRLPIDPIMGSLMIIFLVSIISFDLDNFVLISG